MLENKMVLDSEYYWGKEETYKKEEPAAGYYAIGSDEFVPEDEAYEYALEHVSEAGEEFVDWFFSGNWVHKEV